MILSVKAKLPEDLKNNLKNYDNIIYRDGDIPIIELNKSESATKLFLEYLQNDNNIYEKNGPILKIEFGNPINPYINPLTQVEVLNLLHTYEQYNNKFIVTSFYKQNIQYNCNYSIYLLYLNIQKPIHNECQLLKNLDSGKIICDLNIIYSNVVIIITLYRELF
jgi:hypothetical protein